MSDSFFARHLEAYPNAHRDRANLVLHLFAVPVFIAGFLSIPAGLVTGSWALAGAGAVTALVSIAAQGRGHAREAHRVAFAGPSDFFARILTEQLLTFPR